MFRGAASRIEGRRRGGRIPGRSGRRRAGTPNLCLVFSGLMKAWLRPRPSDLSAIKLVLPRISRSGPYWHRVPLGCDIARVHVPPHPNRQGMSPSEAYRVPSKQRFSGCSPPQMPRFRLGKSNRSVRRCTVAFIKAGFANRSRTHTSYGNEKNRLLVLRPLDAIIPVADALCRGRAFAVD